MRKIICFALFAVSLLAGIYFWQLCLIAPTPASLIGLLASLGLFFFSVSMFPENSQRTP